MGGKKEEELESYHYNAHSWAVIVLSIQMWSHSFILWDFSYFLSISSILIFLIYEWTYNQI